jgi:uncharacterized repeat protein (TIGR01451 family)
MSKSSPKNIILDILRQHPEGLTISSLAEKSGLHRHTSRKYVNELIRTGDVIQRFVGAAKLCYPSCVSNNVNEKKKSFFSRFNIKLISSVILVTFLISEIAINAYANESFNETFNKSSNTSPITSSFVFNDNFQLNDIIETAIKNASGSVERNDSSVPTYETPNDIHPEFSVNMEYPQKITRGETFTVKIYVTNVGSATAKNVVVNLQLPKGFEFTSSSSNCDVLDATSSCISEISVASTVSANLGTNDLKVVINYE